MQNTTDHSLQRDCTSMTFPEGYPHHSFPCAKRLASSESFKRFSITSLKIASQTYKARSKSLSNAQHLFRKTLAQKSQLTTTAKAILTIPLNKLQREIPIRHQRQPILRHENIRLRLRTNHTNNPTALQLENIAIEMILILREESRPDRHFVPITTIRPRFESENTRSAVL